MRADRLLSMLMLLQIKGQMTAEDLAGRLEVSTRTIYRDLDALSAAGVPVYSERGPSGGIALLDNYRTNLTGLTRDEVRSLFMFTVPGLFADLHVEQTQKAANLKLQAALPAPFQKDVDWIRQRIHLDPTGWFHPTEATPFLSIAQEAVWKNKRMRVSYRRSDGGWVKRLLEPYGLVAKAGVWYLVAHASRFTMVYRVSRIMEASLTGTNFTRPEEFDLAAFWQVWSSDFEQNLAKVEVTLRAWSHSITPLAQTVGDGIHDLVEQAQPDEHGCFEVTLTFESVEVACRQLLGLGTIVEVLSPKELRHKMFEEAGKLSVFYAK